MFHSPRIQLRRGIPLVYVGLMQALNRITRIIINGPYGVMLERVPRRPVMIASLMLGAISNLCYLVPGFWPALYWAHFVGALLGGYLARWACDDL